MPRRNARAVRKVPALATKEDIRTGTDIETLSNYKLPYWMRRGNHLRNEALAAEWKELRTICCRYRFGRVELLPVKKSGEAMGLYWGDYIVKTYNTLPPGGRCRLPSRLTAEQVAWVLNCQPHDVPVLVAARLLKPLVTPPANSVKFYATLELLEQAKDRTWLARVTNALNQPWQKKKQW